MVDMRKSTNGSGWISNTDVATSTQSYIGSQVWWVYGLREEVEVEEKKLPAKQIKYKLFDQLSLGDKLLCQFNRSPKQFRHSVCRI